MRFADALQAYQQAVNEHAMAETERVRAYHKASAEYETVLARRQAEATAQHTVEADTGSDQPTRWPPIELVLASSPYPDGPTPPSRPPSLVVGHQLRHAVRPKSVFGPRSLARWPCDPAARH